MSTSGSGADKPKRKTPTKNRSALEYQGEYDPANFIVPASDSKGHSERYTFRLSISMHREVNTIVASKLFPFLDASDVYRWCVREGLEKLNSMQEVPNSVFGQAEAALEVCREVIYHKQFEQMFTVMDEAMEKVRGSGGFSEIRRLYARVQSAFEKMPEGHWRTHYLSTLRRKYLHLIDPAANRVRLEQEAAEALRTSEAGGFRLGMGRRSDDEETGS